MRQLCLRVIQVIFFVYTINIVGQNPFLPPTAFVPDGEPDVFEYNGEKRLFIYGSRDERITGYCGFGHDVWSAPVDDLTEWTNHGEIFSVKQVQEIGYGKVFEQTFGAPDCVYNPVLKKYFLYTFMGKPYKLDGISGPDIKETGTVKGYGDFGPKCVMAESDNPTGPFINPVMCDWPAVNESGTFDPSVIVIPQNDNTVRVYAFWGMRKGDCWAELDPNDMHTIINGRSRKPDRKAWYRTLNNPLMNNYKTLFEASSIKQVAKDKYVFICSANEFIPALSYFYSSSPEGPWNYGGIIVENRTGWNGGNNHGSIVKVKDQWYVIYHRKTCNDYNRQAMIEPIEVIIKNDKVIIPKVEMTSQGIFSEGLNPFRSYYAGTISYLTKGVYIAGDRREPDGKNPVIIAGENPMIGWKYFNFNNIKGDISLRMKMKINYSSCFMSIYVSKPENLLDKDKHILINKLDAGRQIKNDNNFYNVVFPAYKLKELDLNGKMAVIISFKNQNKEPLCEIKEIEFFVD